MRIFGFEITRIKPRQPSKEELEIQNWKEGDDALGYEGDCCDFMHEVERQFDRNLAELTLKKATENKRKWATIEDVKKAIEDIDLQLLKVHE